MARKKAHEDHINHEAWAIPYGDLVTLLLAFFVVMYAVSSINEGKYRVLADSLAEAFGGAPKSIQPLQLGKVQQRGAMADRNTMVSNKMPRGMLATNLLRDMPNTSQLPQPATSPRQSPAHQAAVNRAKKELGRIATEIEKAFAELIQEGLVTVYRNELWLEVEIKADVLFDSGSAEPRTRAIQTMSRLSEVLRTVPNSVRVEGYTDNVPIKTLRFPSNWELAAARAASAVHVLIDGGVSADRLAVVGYGEQRPRADNTTSEGRNANRRVVFVILAPPLPEANGAP